MRKYRCPWCGKPCISFWNRKYRGPHVMRFGRLYRQMNYSFNCPACNGRISAESKYAYVFVAVTIIFIGIMIFLIFSQDPESFGALRWIVLISYFLFLAAVIPLAYNASIFLPFRMDKAFSLPADLPALLTPGKHRSLFRRGIVLAARFSYPTGGDQPVLYPFAIGHIRQAGATLPCSIGFLQPEQVPQEFLKPGVEFDIIDNGEVIGWGNWRSGYTKVKFLYKIKSGREAFRIPSRFFIEKACYSRHSPVISAGTGRPSSFSRVGATSASLPPSLKTAFLLAGSTNIKGTGLVVWAVKGSPVS